MDSFTYKPVLIYIIRVFTILFIITYITNIAIEGIPSNVDEALSKAVTPTFFAIIFTLVSYRSEFSDKDRAGKSE